MHLVVFVAILIVECRCNIRVSVDRSQGKYNVSIADRVWLRSSRTALYADERWYSSDDDSLPLIDTRLDQGNDEHLGKWNETQLIYSLVRSGIQVNVTGRVRQWSSISAVTFHLDIGNEPLTSSNSLSVDEVRTVFPSFNIEQMHPDDHRGYFTYAGEIYYYFLKYITA
ncbi:unnamed protein product [Rotaria socialis]|uniref:Uncharacterized protein n=1 Tax=Rotaria socialis TaxID=392032 RepID=A0A821N4T5_9BILA|nr:unnamed protein product [Rotaria socialis]